jgi:signal transduction histidine kinase
MPKASGLNSKQKGDQFEDEISELYTAMGYDVKRNVPMYGQEIDILATQNIRGSKPYSLIVECKYKGHDKKASNRDIQDIAGAFNIAKSNNLVTGCTVVTTNGFSLSAQEAAASAGIHLTTKHKLVKELIDFSPYLKELKKRYHEDFGEDESSWYIDARGRVGEKEIKSLDLFVDEWVMCPQKYPLALLGSYGTGKTSFCRHYAVRIIETPKMPIPIIISLRDFHKQMKIESLIRDFMDEECSSPSPRFESFYRMYEEHMLLIIFDGFDEMASRVDSTILEANLHEIEKFAGVNGNVILTCRPEFFTTNREKILALAPKEDPLSERMAKYQPVEIELWSSTQISRYVKKRVSNMTPPPSKPHNYYIERIKNLPELSDMSTRAVHLDLIVKILPTMIKKRIPITRPNLYRTYIQQELRRETIKNKRLRVISDNDRMELMRTVAAEGFLNSSDELNFEAATKVVMEKLKPPRSELESITRDFLNRSFLRRQGDKYQFAHKSMGEYLFAEVVYENIIRGKLEIIDRQQYSSAVAGMVLELFGGMIAFNKMLEAINIEDSKVTVTFANYNRFGFAVKSLHDYISGILFFCRNNKSIKKEQNHMRHIFVILAHVTKNLMATIKLYIDCQKDEQTKKRANIDKSPLSGISRAWGKLLYMIDHLKKFCFNRLTFDLEFNLEKENINLAALAYNAACIPENKLKISSRSCIYYGYKDYISRIFENIAMNVKRSIEKGGDFFMNINEDEKRNGIIITFMNTGVPIPSENLSKIFDEGSTTRPNGTGLGLDIVEIFVTLHGGTVQVRSEKHETIIEIFLPRNQKTIKNTS